MRACLFQRNSVFSEAFPDRYEQEGDLAVNVMNHYVVKVGVCSKALSIRWTEQPGIVLAV